MFQNKTLGELLLVAGLWLAASAAHAAPQSGPAMPVAGYALPPPGYTEFCQRKPLDCGADRGLILAEAREAVRERAQLVTQSAALAAPVLPAALTPTPEPMDLAGGATPAWGELLKVSTETVETVVRADIAATVQLQDPAEPASRQATEARPLSMGPHLWALLSQVNGDVNRAITKQSDLKTYGVEDYWNTPLEDGGRYGDCEDFVLEKERALIAAGVPRQALNIALVRTSWGEGHAVLLVSTNEGEYVLDSLSPVVTPWRNVPYRWIKRQVDGEAFHWVMIDEDAIARPAARRLLIAWGR